MRSYGGHFEADGGSYDLVIPFRPDVLKLWNYTQFGVDGGVGLATFFRDMAAGDAMTMVRIDNDGGSDRTSLALETTNGFTDNFNSNLDGTGFTAYTSGGIVSLVGGAAFAMSGGSFQDRNKAITGATQANPVVLTVTAHGFGAAAATGEVRITDVGGMVELNNNRYAMTVVDANSFNLQTIGDPAEWKVTLGSTIYGSDSDEIFFEAYQMDTYTDLGDIA